MRPTPAPAARDAHHPPLQKQETVIMAITNLSHVTIIVPDQNEALAWYTEKLGYEKRADDGGSMPGSRWLNVAPKALQGLEIALFQARDERERSRVGQGTLWVLETDDCRTTCKELETRGGTILSQPDQMPWGVSAIIQDLYGNPYNLLEVRRGRSVSWARTLLFLSAFLLKNRNTHRRRCTADGRDNTGRWARSR